MATVRMKKGNKYADIFDSPETIKQAQLDGYSLCEQEKKTETVKEKVEETQKSETDGKKTASRGRDSRQ